MGRRVYWRAAKRAFDQRRSSCPCDKDCYSRRKEIPQQIVRRQTISNSREETVKIRLLIPLAGLAISFALPTFAQQTNTPDPQIRQQLVALVQKFDDAYSNNDPAALVAL